MQRFTSSIEHLINTSETIHEFLDKILEESKSLERHATEVDEIQLKSIVEFQKAYEVYYTKTSILKCNVLLFVSTF